MGASAPASGPTVSAELPTGLTSAAAETSRGAARLTAAVGGPSAAATGPSAAVGAAEVAAAAAVRLAGLTGDAAAWSAAERHTLLRRLDHAVDALSAVRAAVLVAERDQGTWRGAGDRSFEAWRSRTGGGGERSMAAQARQAEQLGAVPSAASAVAEGRISLEHATVIARVASTGTPAQQRAARCVEGQDHLLGLAERLDAGTFAGTVARWASTIDPDALERDHQAQRAERFLHLADTARGTLVKGRLDSMAGHRLRLALEALSPRPAADDDRDAGQRGADALDAMAGRILASTETRPGGHVPPQVSFIVPAETWAAARAERDRRRRAVEAGGRAGAGAGAGAGASGPEPAGYAPATLEDGTPVPAGELARVMCDCDITRVVIDADGVPLDLGRTQRLFTREQRRAVIARDRECVWPDCHLHARWAEVHHIRWWERDAGPTSVENGALLCAFHHHEVHRRDLVVTRLRAVPAGVPTARGRPRDRVAPAPASYEFRDRAGRRVGAGPVVPPGSAPGSAPGPAAPRPALPPGITPGRTLAHRGHDLAGRTFAHRGDDAVEPDLVWTTDDVTGARMPALLL